MAIDEKKVIMVKISREVVVPIGNPEQRERAENLNLEISNGKIVRMCLEVFGGIFAGEIAKHILTGQVENFKTVEDYDELKELVAEKLEEAEEELGLLDSK